MSSKRIYFRDVSQPFENSAAVRRWCVECYDDAGTLFPVGMVWVAEVVGVGAQISFVLVADEWRRNGIGKTLMESVKSRWPNIVATGPMGDIGRALLDSVGLNDVTDDEPTQEPMDFTDPPDGTGESDTQP